jgi:hypothetical protein
LVREVSAFAGRPHCVLRPAEQHGSLGYVERPRAVLEHLWNTNVVDGWGPLVIPRLYRRYAARIKPVGW